MSKLSLTLMLVALLCGGMLYPSQAQGDDSPTAVVKKFYQQLHARKYLDGLRLSVYGPAVEGLSPDELRELESDFSRIAEGIPENVETTGEQISGDTATVFIKLPGAAGPQDITLARIDGHWRVGDRETYKLVKGQGREFFFNARISVRENEAAEWLEEIFGAETVYFKAKSRFTTLEELLSLGGISKQLANDSESGYRFELKVAENGQGFTATAVPVRYGRTGRRSFYIDEAGVIRAEDKQGQAATAASPKYQIIK
ncbi:MAG TPA: hypothetical protein VFD58_26015 [Blastocatellia bacterium]|nr:hypothetical protein [Blastocatellia bacterium]